MAQRLFPHIYPLSPPHRTRSPNRPMRILALGLPRSGTDSLRTALATLGYNPIWHGFEMPLSRPTESALWVPLLRAKARGDNQPGKSMNWDVILGDCEVVMDMPPGVFAEELLDFYPDAKVILNRRRNMDSWHRSLGEAADMVLGSWFLWMLSWFDAELFWWYWSAVLWMGIMGKGVSFEKYGKEWGVEYYERLERKMWREGKLYLDWVVQDGWEPLCDFLGTEVPNEEFPWKNKAGDEFQKNADKAVEKMVRRSLMRIGLIMAVVVAVVASWLWGLKGLRT